VISYRRYNHFDPPRLAEVWNASLTGRRAVVVQSPALLEYCTFAKPYFDPDGLLFAADDDRVVGFAHAGFASAGPDQAVDPAVGVVCVLGVAPAWRRQGVGSELLRRSEDYLRRRGAREVRFGALAPHNPFLFALYGGCDSPGVLASDTLARPFLERHGYQAVQTCGVFQCDLTRVQPPGDPRFAALRQGYDILAVPYRAAGWWRECVLGPIEAVEYRLQEGPSAAPAARAVLWDMETFSQGWGQPCVGLLEVEVAPAHRRQGMARYLLTQVMRHLRQQPFEVMEAQADLDNPAALALLQTLGFHQVDAGACFRRQG
jgi:ribosomal protein S18 acetylase RimI-like enzyme